MRGTGTIRPRGGRHVAHPACGGSRHGDGHAAVGDVAVVILSFDIGEPTGRRSGFRRGVARGEVPPVSVTANAILSPGRRIHPHPSRHDNTVESVFPIGG
jgi:hypothetical protein